VWAGPKTAVPAQAVKRATEYAFHSRYLG
jgi:hypothetical protein